MDIRLTDFENYCKGIMPLNSLFLFFILKAQIFGLTASGFYFKGEKDI